MAKEVVAEVCDQFARLQAWRMERGGWNRGEVQLQLGIKESKGREEQITEALLKVREKWLFAWFKEQQPNRAQELLEKLIIVHDELQSSFLYLFWALGGGDLKVRREEFQKGTPRQIFKSVNTRHGEPLKLVVQKSRGFPADYYEPRTWFWFPFP